MKGENTINLIDDCQSDEESIKYSFDEQYRLPFKDSTHQIVNSTNKSSLKKRQNIKNLASAESKRWTEQDQRLLITLHKKLGNKWTELAQYYPGTSQNFIKNHFYSRLRKSIRKLNKLIYVFFSKKYNKFKLNVIFMLSNISEGKIAQKSRIDQPIFAFYRNFLYEIIDFSENFNCQQRPYKLSEQKLQELQSLILCLIALENLFRLIRGQRTTKGKRKNIAYLRQFRFRLGLFQPLQMVITKENIFLEDSSQMKNILQQKNFDSNYNQIFNFDALIEKSSSSEESISIENSSEVRSIQNDKLSNFIKLQEKISYKTIDSSMDSFKEHTQEQIQEEQICWRDYYGHQMKELDIYSDPQIWKNPEFNFEDLNNYNLDI